jgi:hypothetical protein
MKESLLEIVQQLQNMAEGLNDPPKLPVVLDLTKQYRHLNTGYVGMVAKVDIRWGESIVITLHTQHQNGWPAVIVEPLESFEVVKD